MDKHKVLLMKIKLDSSLYKTPLRREDSKVDKKLLKVVNMSLDFLLDISNLLDLYGLLPMLRFVHFHK